MVRSAWCTVLILRHFCWLMGLDRAIASVFSVHMAELVTTAASGLSHWKFGNIDKSVVKKLIIPVPSVPFWVLVFSAICRGNRSNHLLLHFCFC